MKPADRFTQAKWARTGVSPELPGDRPLRDCDTETRREPTALPSKEQVRQLMRGPLPAGPALSRGAQPPEMAPPMVSETEPGPDLSFNQTLLGIVGLAAIVGLILVCKKSAS